MKLNRKNSLLLACVVCLPTFAQWRQVKKSVVHNVETRERVDLKRSFPIQKDKTVIEEKRQKLWKIWREAHLAHFTPQLQEGQKKVYEWTIPDTLEPNAILNYRFFETPAVKGKQRNRYVYAVESDSTKLPFFLYLHGSGPRDHEFKTGYKLAQHYGLGKTLFFIPQIPNVGEWYRWYQRSKQWVYDGLLRQVFIREDVDPYRTYIFGISEGGYGSQRLASFYADYWAAAAPMAGGEPLKNAPAENLLNTPFSLRTGEWDRGFYRYYLTTKTRMALDSLARGAVGHYKHWVTLVPESFHAINYTPSPQWLLQWRREAQPQRVCWEDFEMDGVHRKGFANLEVLKSPSAGRVRYDVNVEKNRVDVQVRDVQYTTTEVDPKWGIHLAFAKQYRPASGGKLRVYLSEQMIDMHKPVVVYCNGQKVGKIGVQPELRDMVRSLELFYDPLRIFSMHVDIDY